MLPDADEPKRVGDKRLVSLSSAATSLLSDCIRLAYCLKAAFVPEEKSLSSGNTRKPAHVLTKSASPMPSRRLLVASGSLMSVAF